MGPEKTPHPLSFFFVHRSTLRFILTCFVTGVIFLPHHEKKYLKLREEKLQIGLLAKMHIKKKRPGFYTDWCPSWFGCPTPHPSPQLDVNIPPCSKLSAFKPDLSLVFFVDHGPNSPVSRFSTTDPDCFSRKLRHGWFLSVRWVFPIFCWNASFESSSLFLSSIIAHSESALHHSTKLSDSSVHMVLML